MRAIGIGLGGFTALVASWRLTAAHAARQALAKDFDLSEDGEPIEPVIEYPRP